MVRLVGLTMPAMDLETFDKLPDSALLLRSAAAKLAGGVHINTLARWSSAGHFPQPVRIVGQVAYRVGDLRAWLANVAATREAVTP